MCVFVFSRARSGTYLFALHIYELERGRGYLSEPRLFVEGDQPSLFGEVVPVVVQIDLYGQWEHVLGDRRERNITINGNREELTQLVDCQQNSHLHPFLKCFVSIKLHVFSVHTCTVYESLSIIVCTFYFRDLVTLVS